MLRLISLIWTRHSKQVINVSGIAGQYLKQNTHSPKFTIHTREFGQNSKGNQSILPSVLQLDMDYKKIREDSLKIFNNAVESVSPGKMITNSLCVSDDGNQLTVDGRDYHLNSNVYVVGFGKAVAGMAAALQDMLGRHIVEGVISVPIGSHTMFPSLEKLEQCKIQVLEGAENNLTDDNAHKAAMDITNLVHQLGENDLLVVLITGGGSALLPSPAPPISLRDLLQLTRVMSTHGATIDQLNTVRQNVETLKGGGLARLARPAHVISLILSDVVGDKLDIISSGPTVPCQTSAIQCLQVLHQLNIVDQIPHTVMETLQDHAGRQEDDLESSYDHVHNVIVGSNSIATTAAYNTAMELGYVPSVLTNTLQGEVLIVAAMFVRLVAYIVYCHKTGSESIKQENDDLDNTEAKLISDGIPNSQLSKVSDVTNQAFKNGKGVCIICGGETTVNVKGTGKGGRNQEMAVAFAAEYNKLVVEGGSMCSLFSNYHVEFLSAGTDGQDGPTDAAGAVVNKDLVTHADAAGVNLTEYLENNDSYTVLKMLNGGEYMIQTGLTGTNVMDVQLLTVHFRS